LAQALPPETTLTLNSVGGADGVTGANQFATRGDPDGRMVLMAPGQAATAWLVGDPRAKYDIGRWTPLMVGVTPGLLVARPGALRAGMPARVEAGASPVPALAGLLALEILGFLPQPVRVTAAYVVQAFAAGELDAVFVRGHNAAVQLRALTAAGGEPVLALASRSETGELVRDAFALTVPILPDLTDASGPLVEAFHAVGAATQTDFALVLPNLTPADRVALWRVAATEAQAALNVQTFAHAVGSRPLSGPEAAATLRAAVAGQAAQVALRQWLKARFNWQPA
jgi:hypothetical protein